MDEAVLTRIRALPGADAPVSSWFIAGAGETAFPDYAPTGNGQQP